MDTPSQQNLNQLPLGTILGDFKITGVVGEGGFGIVYLAYESTLDRTVAIKEYLPSSIAGRTGNQSVMVRSQLNSNAFASGLRNFLREAQMLARFSHPAMVEVHRVWEQNCTAYMAMRYYPGKTVRELRQASSDFDEASIRRILEPVFDALSLLHAQNVIHRDVSPDNILMRGNGAPVLLDLGAARLVIGGMTQALTTVLKPGYAPIEQYVDDGTMQQGPWTDVYGLGAVLYFLLTGGPPPQAVARMITDPLRNMAAAVKVPVAPEFVDAVVKALAVRPDHRYQSVDELREGLGWTDPMPIEPRTTFAHLAAAPASLGAAPVTGGPSTGSRPRTVTQPASQPVTTTVAPVTAAPAPPATAPLPRTMDRAAASDSDATVVWKGPASTGPAGTAPTPIAAPAEPAPTATSQAPASRASVPPASEPRPVSTRMPPPQVRAALAAEAAELAGATAATTASGAGVSTATRERSPSNAPTDAAAAQRSREYGERSGNGKLIAAAVAAVLAAGGGYFLFGRSQPANTEPTSNPPAATTVPPSAPPPGTDAANAMPKAEVPAPAVVASPPPAPVPAPPAAAPLAPVAPTADSKAPPRVDADEQAAAKAKREAEEKAKARLEAQEKAAKAKAEADERAKAKAKQDADERAAASAQRSEAEERARKTRQDEEDRLAAAKARQDAAERAATKSSQGSPTPAPPQQRTVDELSSLAMASFRRGETLAARNLWTEIVNHPQATARSKAVAYNNMAVSYCQNGDEASCERMYIATLRADRNYNVDAGEREHPHFKRAYERAARLVRGQ